MNRISARHLCLAGVAAMALAGCSAAIAPMVDAVLTAVFGAVVVGVLLAVAGLVGRWACREWVWRRELHRPVPAPVPLAARTTETARVRPVLVELVEVAS
jgi:hypothetical protein